MPSGHSVVVSTQGSQPCNPGSNPGDRIVGSSGGHPPGREIPLVEPIPEWRRIDEPPGPHSIQQLIRLMSWWNDSAAILRDSENVGKVWTVSMMSSTVRFPRRA